MDMLTEEAMADLERRWKAAVAANFKCEHGERTGYCDLCTDATEHFESVARCYLPALLHEVREARGLLKATESVLRDHDCFAMECPFCSILREIRRIAAQPQK